MNIHKNARLTPGGRLRIVERVRGGETARVVAAGAGVSVRTVWKWYGGIGTRPSLKGSGSRRQAASSRSDPPTTQRLDREDNRERAGHSEDIESPDEQQGAALLEKLRAQSIPHVQGQHPGGHQAAK